MISAVRIAIVCFVSLAVLSCDQGTHAKRVERRTQAFDFGVGRQGAVIHHTFVVTNTGSAPVKVARVQTTCGCTVADVPKDTVIGPGKSLDVPVNLNLRGKTNPVESKVIVDYVGDVEPDELILKGTVSEEYPNLVTLPKIKRGEQVEQVVVFATYPGQPPLQVNDIVFDKTKFDITARPGLKPETVDVVFKPAANAPFGAVSDQVVVKTNDTEAPDKPLTVRMHVMKPLEAVSQRLILHPGNPGETVSGVVELKSTYGEPITDVSATVSREKRFTATVEPDSPPGVVRVRVVAHPPENMKKPYAQALLTVAAKVGDYDVKEKITVTYTAEKTAPVRSDAEEFETPASDGRESPSAG